jgi:hypothetical protein
MGDLMRMEIAGVRYLLSCSDSITLEEFPSIYQPFLKQTLSERGSIALQIRLELDEIPDTGKMRKIFDTEQSWSLYADRDEYVMALNPPGLKQRAVWVARFNKGFSSIIVYCSDVLRRETGAGRRVSNPILYPLDQLLLIHVLAQNRGALIHAAGLGLHGQGYIFPGRSGTGKSTLSSLLRGLGNAELLSDDRIAVREIDGRFHAYGTPWSGEQNMAENKRVPLAGIFFVRQGLGHCIREIGAQEAFEKLMPVLSMPWYDRGLVTEMLTFCEELIATVPAYELSFKKDIDVCKTFGAFVSR